MTSAGDTAENWWERHAGWWQEVFAAGADPEYEEQILPMAAEHLGGSARVLDVGTGEGQLARLAIRTGAGFVVGIDPTPAQLTAAVERAGGVRYAQGVAAALPFPAGSFDTVIACLVFEHIEDFEPAIAEVARVLRPSAGFSSSSTIRSCRRRGVGGSMITSSKSSTGGSGPT